jgi:hypothetical protein
MNPIMRILLLMLLSQCKPWLPLLAAGPERTGLTLQTDTVLTPGFVVNDLPIFSRPDEYQFPPPRYFWQPMNSDMHPYFTVSLPDPKIDSLKQVVDSMAGLQRAQLRTDSVLQVQLKQQQQKFSSLQQVHATTLREKSWFRAASMVMGGVFLIGMIWVGWRYRVRASP